MFLAVAQELANGSRQAAMQLSVVCLFAAAVPRYLGQWRDGLPQCDVRLSLFCSANGCIYIFEELWEQRLKMHTFFLYLFIYLFIKLGSQPRSPSSPSGGGSKSGRL